MPIETEAKFLMRDPATLRTVLKRHATPKRLTQCYVPGRAIFSSSEPAVTMVPDDAKQAPKLGLSILTDDHDLALRLPGATAGGVTGEIRFRRQEDDDGTHHFVTFKIPVGDDLLEIEEWITPEEFAAVQTTAQVRKTRYTLPVAGGQWDVDFLHPTQVDAILMGLIEFEGASLDAIAVHPLLKDQVGARIPREDQLLFTNRRLCDARYAAEVADDYLSGRLFREGQAKAVPGVTVLHARYEHSHALHEAVCGEPDDVLAAAARQTIAESGYRAVARFSTDSLDEALAMTTHGRVIGKDEWQLRHEPARHRPYSPSGRTKEQSSCDGSLFVHAGEGYVLNERRQFVPIGPVDAEAIHAAYPWP